MNVVFSTCVHLWAKLGQKSLLRIVRWHCPPDTRFEIGALAVWGRARYLSVTKTHHNIKSLRVRGEETFCFFEIWRPEWGSNPRSPTFQAGSFNRCTRAPALFAFPLHRITSNNILITFCVSMIYILHLIRTVFHIQECCNNLITFRILVHFCLEFRKIQRQHIIKIYVCSVTHDTAAVTSTQQPDVNVRSARSSWHQINHSNWLITCRHDETLTQCWVNAGPEPMSRVSGVLT